MNGSKPIKSTLMNSASSIYSRGSINSVGSINLELLYSNREEQKEDEKNQYSDDDDENYIIQANICPRLSRELNLPEISYNYMGDYEPPKQYGLSNCNAIIPEYYQLHEKPSKIFKIDYFEIIKDDIRNCRILNEYQLKYIKELPEEHKNELFELFNSCVKTFNDIINNS